ADDQFGELVEIEERQHGRDDADRRDHGHADHHAAQGEDEGDQVEDDEASLLAFVVGDVEGLENGLGAIVGAPQRGQQRDQKTYAQGVGTLAGQGFQLRLDQIHPAFRKNAAEKRDLLGYGVRVGYQSIER